MLMLMHLLTLVLMVIVMLYFNVGKLWCCSYWCLHLCCTNVFVCSCKYKWCMHVLIMSVTVLSFSKIEQNHQKIRSKFYKHLLLNSNDSLIVYRQLVRLISCQIILTARSENGNCWSAIHLTSNLTTFAIRSSEVRPNLTRPNGKRWWTFLLRPSWTIGYVVSVLLNLLNNSADYSSGHFPSCWRRTYVTLISKDLSSSFIANS